MAFLASEQDEHGYLLLSGSDDEEEEEDLEPASSSPTTTTTTTPRSKRIDKHVEKQLREYLQPKARRARERKRKRNEKKRRTTTTSKRRKWSESGSDDLDRQEEEFRVRAEEDPGPTIREATSERRPHRHQNHVHPPPSPPPVRRSSRTRRRPITDDYDYGENEDEDEDIDAEADMVEIIGNFLQRVLPKQKNGVRNGAIGQISEFLMNINDDEDAVLNPEEGTVVPRRLEGMDRRLRPRPPVSVGDSWIACVDPDMCEVFRQLGHPGDRSECWGCQKIGGNGAVSDCRAWNNLTKMYYDNMGRGKPVELAKQLCKYFDDQIRRPANRRLRPGQDPVPEWRAVDILMHMTVHTNEPVLRTNHVIGQLNRMIDSLFTYGAYERNAAFKWMTRPRSSAIVDLQKLVRMVTGMYKSNPERMFGASQNSALASTASSQSWICQNKPSYGSNRSHPSRLTESSA